MRRIIGVVQEKPTVKQEVPVQGSLFDTAEIPVQQEVTHTYDNINTLEHKYTLVENENDRKNLIENLSNQKEFCFDTETTGLVIHGSEIIGVAFSYKKNESFYVTLPNSFEDTRLILKEFKILSC